MQASWMCLRTLYLPSALAFQFKISALILHRNACEPANVRAIELMYGTAFELDLELACCKNQPKPSPDPPQTLQKPIPNSPKSTPRAPKSVQKRPQASQSAQQAPQGRPKSAQERPSAARTLPKTALNRAQIAIKTNFYVLLSLSLFKSNSLSILFAIFPTSFMSPTLNFIGFLEGKRYFSPNRYFRSTSKKSP